MKSAMKPYRIPIRPPKRPTPDSSENGKDPVQVFLRIRPLQSESDLSCVRIISSTTVALTAPEIAINYKVWGANRETQYVFKHVFGPRDAQRQAYAAVAQPLVENLIKGKNGLLFTYGVTGSGKTYTMTGDNRDRGIMPRCIDALFKTISDYQSKKFVFKPDRLNGFEILSEADAMSERQQEMASRFAKPHRKDSDPEIASQASAEASMLNGIDEDNMYAVFVTYIEVYNNCVYDLLEEVNNQKTLQTKIIREDANHNMYVHGVTEIEIKSLEEAIECFQTGQKRKRMGHTILNAESSRSHSVFTIRLVQAPTDSQGETVLQDKHTISISQLSLVDLAGSERTNRTKNTGQRLREAGNINNSLMTLRTCLEYLRENQLHGTNKKIPYRDSKITHLFKNYFDGEGQVSMIVCINPRAEDYDETAQVMKFAEMTQEVQVSRQTPAKLDVVGLTPGRRKANKIFKMAVKNLQDIGYSDAASQDIDIGLVYSLGPSFPNFKLDSPDCDRVLRDLIEHLKHRIEKRHILLNDFNIRSDNFRKQLLQMERENTTFKTEIASAEAMLSQERNRTTALNNKLICYEGTIEELNRKLRDREDRIKGLERQLNQKQIALSQKELEKEKQKKKFTTKIAVETDKMNRELELKLREQKNKLQQQMKLKDEKLRLVSNILNTDDIAIPSQMGGLIRSLSSENIAPATSQVRSEATPTNKPTTSALYYTPRPHRGVPVANPRHRRSRSGGDKWLEHRPENPVPLGTIFQPYYHNRKSITKLTTTKDLMGPKTSKYCLISQDADTDGDVETHIFKGEVIPTVGGGAQVIFNDVETLKQTSPVNSPMRKRPSDSNDHQNPIKDIASRCNTGIEGHSSKKAKI